jgi:hypothetical protein
MVMNSLFALTLVALSMACEDCPGDFDVYPMAYVIQHQIAVLNESYTFNFAFGESKPLDKSEINLKKVVRFEPYLEIADTDFEVSLKILSEEELEEWKDHEGHEMSSRFDHLKWKLSNVILGRVKIDQVTCEDQRPYVVSYGYSVQYWEWQPDPPVHSRPKLTGYTIGRGGNISPGGNLFWIEVKGCKPIR